MARFTRAAPYVGTMIVENHDGVRVVRLDRPERLNAIDPATARELLGLAREAAADATLRAVVFTGNGRAFSAGADITALNRFATPAELLGFLDTVGAAFDAIEALPVVTIAAVNGMAFGGGLELALACDFRIVAADARLGLPEIAIGVLPGAGGTQRLPRLIPPSIAKQMICFGEPIDAETALRHGLANEVVPVDRVLDTALEWAARLAARPPLAIRAAKELVRASGSGDLASGLDAEQRAVGFLFGTEDGREGIRAFVEKRRPTFRGR
ncbi:MAG: enoyl-CoA hydratase [Candidatus Binatota bacterium]|nr:enoyl-CoA hydratase [Candidatus Binatota bacterium]